MRRHGRSTKLEIGKPVDIKFDKRYATHNRDHTIRDVYDALVELITNADDSYARLYKHGRIPKDGGNIIIEYLAQRKGKPSLLVVRDRAEGMDLKDMTERLLWMGRRSSELGNRGYMGRGARDCTALGEIIFEAIKNDRFYKCRITHGLEFIPEGDGLRVTAQLRDRLGISRGNGTSVTISLIPRVTLPRFDSLASDLPRHYALRDIMGEYSPARVKLRKMATGQSQRLVYRQPDGELVLEKELDIPNYPAAKATLKIWKSSSRLEPAGRGDRFQRCGIVIKGQRAVHECSWPTSRLKNDPYAEHFFGRLDCPFIDELLADYEERFRQKQDFDETNPRLVIDPSRRGGLERTHPFAKSLLAEAGKKLEGIVKEYRDAERKVRREVANAQTKERLNRLARKAGQYLRDQLEDTEETGGGESIVDGMISKKGVVIYPPFARVDVGEKKSLTLYVRNDLVSEQAVHAFVDSDNPEAVQLLAPRIKLRPHATKNDRHLGTIGIRGLKVADAVLITAKISDLPPAEARVEVAEKKLENHQFEEPLEFDRAKCKLTEGRRKKVKLFAQYPEVVQHQTPVRVLSLDAKRAEIHGRCVLKPIEGTNYALCDVTISGRTLNSDTKIVAEVNGYKAELDVSVVQDSGDDRGYPLDFDIRDEDFGGARALWNTRESKPHQLLISARHNSIARYLGPAEEGYPGQDTPLFRVLLAEIIASNVIRKLLPLEAAERPGDFPWAEEKENDVIAEDLLTEYQRRLRKFVSDAHAIMVDETEIKKSQESIGEENLSSEVG